MSAGPASRRLFLFRGAAATAGAALAAPALASALPSAVPAESPALLALGMRLTAAVATFDTTNARKTEARAHFERVKPGIPAELLAENVRPLRVALEIERDVEDKSVWPPFKDGRPQRARHHVDSHGLNRAIEDADGRTRSGRELRRLRKIAVAYEQAVEDAKGVVDWSTVETAEYFARREIAIVTEEAFKLPAVTITGVVIKARSVVAARRARDSHRHGLASPFGEDLAAEIVAMLAREDRS